jgi:hypothetical protein
MTYKETLEKAKQNGIGALELKIADMVDIYLTDIDEKLSDEKFESLCDIVDDKLKSMDGEIPYTLYDVVEEAFEENYSKMFSEADLVLDELDYEETEDGISVDKFIFDDYQKDTYVNIKFIDNNDEDDVRSYKMVGEDDERIYFEYIG